MAGSIVHFLISRKYLGWYVDLHYRSKETHMANLDRLSVDWHYLITRMTEVGTQGMDGDFKFWDRFINAVINYADYYIKINSLVKLKIVVPESIKFYTLGEFFSRPDVIFGELVFTANGLTPSGALNTYNGNCDKNEIIHRAGYLAITRRTSPLDCSIRVYKTKTRGIRGGDDTWQQIMESLLPYFNGKLFADWCASKNITMTDPDKSKGDMPKSKHFKEIQFLKNKTGRMHGFYVPLADYESTIEQCYWVRLNKNNADIVKATEDNTNAALRALYYYGEEKFEQVRDAFLRKAPQLQLLTFAELNMQWHRYGFFPGSQPDYATKIDQDKFSSLHPYQQMKFKTGDKQKLDNDMKIMESIYEAGIITGIDKNSLSVQATHPTAGLDEHIPIKVINEAPPATTSNPTGSETQVNGAFIQSKEEPIKKQLVTGNVKVKPADFRAQGHVNDKNWTLAKLASKFTSLGQISWATSATPGTVLKKWDIPNDILVTPALKTPFDVTAYSRFQSVTFKITCSASPFYAGRLICGFYPSMAAAAIPLPSMHLLLTQMGGVVLNPVENQTVEFSIPYRHFLDWLEYPGDCAGQFYIVVLNSLRTGTANTNNITISAFASIENAQFKVPEYVQNTTKSQKYIKMKSTPQSGMAEDNEDTAITISKYVSTVNENFQENATMMCAGVGVYVEPLVKQFPDHPIDLAQMMKRDMTYETVQLAVEPFNDQTGAPGFAWYRLDYNEIIDVITARYNPMFSMFRGGIMIKGDFKAFDKNEPFEERPLSWEGKVFFANQPIAFENQDMDFYNTEYHLNMGYTKFDQHNPFVVTGPHWQPNFASYFRGGSTVNENPMTVFYVQFYNFSPRTILIRGNIEARIDDDFTMGVFRGFPPMQFVTTAKRRKERLTIIQSMQQSGIIDSAQDWVVGKAQDVASSLAKTAVDSVFDLARENLEPVMDVVDFVGNLLDAPPVTLQPAPYMSRKWGYGNANNIMQYTDRLGVTNHNGGCYTDKSTYGTDKVETNMYALMTEIKTLWKTIPWTTAATPGQLLNFFQVGINNTEDIYNNNNKVCVPMDYFARDFNYWAGSIIYAIDIVASQMHTGRLVVSYHPNIENPPNNFTLDQATQQYFLSFDIDRGKGCAVFEIPYLFKRPFRAVPGLKRNPPTDSLYPYDESFNGIVCIWVMNPLRGSETVANSVDVNLYKMAGKDFRLEGYGNPLNYKTD